MESFWANWTATSHHLEWLNLRSKYMLKQNQDQDLLSSFSWSFFRHFLNWPIHIMQVNQKINALSRKILARWIQNALSAFNFSFSKGGLIAKRPTDMLDGYPFFLGISCLLRQYPTTIMDTVIEYVAQYIRSFVKEQAR